MGFNSGFKGLRVLALDPSATPLFSVALLQTVPKTGLEPYQARKVVVSYSLCLFLDVVSAVTLKALCLCIPE